VKHDYASEIANAAPVALVHLDARGHAVYANPFFERLTGIRSSDIAGRDWFEACLDERDRDRIRKLLFGTAEGDGTPGRICPVGPDGGRRAIVEWSSQPLAGADGEDGGLLAIGLDVTERRRPASAGDALALHRLTDQVPGAVFEFRLRPDRSSGFTYLSRGIADIYEVPPEEAIRDASLLPERIHPDDRKMVSRSIWQSADDLSQWRMEYRVVLPVRGERWISGEATPEKLADGSIVWHGYIHDVTERKNAQLELEKLRDNLQELVEERTRDAEREACDRKKAQAELSLNLKRTQLLMNSAADGIVTIDQTGAINSFNTSAERMFGYSVFEVIGKNVSILMGEATAEKHDGYIADHLRGSGRSIVGKTLELQARRKSGEMFPIELAVSETRDEGQVLFTAIVRDISERKASERTLNEVLADLKSSREKIEKSEAQLHQILESSSAGVTILRTDPIERIFANRRFLEMFGAGSLDELNARDYRATFVSDADFQRATSELRARDGYDRAVMQRRRLDGSTWWSLVDAMAIDFDGAPAVIVWYFDISHQKKAEQELVQSEKMASLGGLVAGIAHEVNTPLGVSVTAATYLEEKVAELAGLVASGDLRRKNLEKFLEAAGQSSSIISTNLHTASNLVRSFKQVAVDQSSGEMRSFSLLEYADEVIRSLHPKLKQTRHRVEVEGDRDIILTSYPGAVSQILTNFIMNSLIHAYDEGGAGTLKISATRSGDKVLLRYSDDGRGVSQEVLNKIFDPFFTTSRGSGGSGLGMNIVYNLITQKLCGTVTCASEPGEGITFNITIPTDRGTRE
jgi:PAS domain S-box-containing protein